MKKGFLKRLAGKIFGNPIVRGIIKSVPGGNIAYEIGSSIISNSETKKTGVANTKPHSAISIVCQVVFLSLIVYAFITKQISIETILQFISIDDFKNDLVPVVTSVTDTLNTI